MISKTQISKRATRKRNPELVKTIELAKKNGMLELSKKLSSPRSNHTSINLDALDKVDGDKVVVVGKVLGSGDIDKKKTICALGFSQQAKKKLKKAGCEVKSIKDEIEKNKELKGVKIIG